MLRQETCSTQPQKPQQPLVRNSRNILVNGRPTRLIEVILILDPPPSSLPLNTSETECPACAGCDGPPGDPREEYFQLELQHRSGLVSQEEISQQWQPSGSPGSWQSSQGCCGKLSRRFSVLRSYFLYLNRLGIPNFPTSTLFYK